MIALRKLTLLALGLGAATTALAQSTVDKVQCTPGLTCPPLIPTVPTARPFACATIEQADFPGPSLPIGGDVTLAECAQLASGSAAFDFEPSTPGDFFGQGICFEDSEVVISGTTVCTDPEALLIYFYDGPAPSLLPRQKEETRRRLLLARDTSICPDGLTACRVQNSDNGFECLDTTSELESCGGCRFGLFEGSSVVDDAMTLFEKAVLLRKAKQQKTLVKSRRHARALTVAAEVTVGLDCSDRTLFGDNMTCKQGTCVPVA